MLTRKRFRWRHPVFFVEVFFLLWRVCGCRGGGGVVIDWSGLRMLDGFFTIRSAGSQMCKVGQKLTVSCCQERYFLCQRLQCFVKEYRIYADSGVIWVALEEYLYDVARMLLQRYIKTTFKNMFCHTECAFQGWEKHGLADQWCPTKAYSSARQRLSGNLLFCYWRGWR